MVEWEELNASPPLHLWQRSENQVRIEETRVLPGGASEGVSPVRGAEWCGIRLWALLDYLKNHNQPLGLQKCIENLCEHLLSS